MTKKLVLLGLALMSTLSSYAQVSVRPEIGINFSNATVKLRDKSKNLHKIGTNDKTGGTAGMQVKIAILKNFYLQPGIIYSNLGFNQTEKYQGKTYQQRFTLHYVQLPLNLGYSFDIDSNQLLFITGTAYLGYATGEKIKRENESDYSIRFGNSDYDDLKRRDVGIKLGFGYQTRIGIFCHAQYILGATNLFPNDDWGMFQNHGFSFSIGYDIPVKM